MSKAATGSASEHLAAFTVGPGTDATLQRLSGWAVDGLFLDLRQPCAERRQERIAGVLAEFSNMAMANDEHGSIGTLAFRLGCASAASVRSRGTGGPVDLTAVVVPAVAAAAVVCDASREEVLNTISIGMEVTARIALGLGADYVRRGWDLSSAIGRIGAAAAVARLLGAGATEVQHAIGVAATQANGLRAAQGSGLGLVQIGQACWDAAEAAQLALAGFTSPPGSLDGRRGLGAVSASGFDLATATAAIGTVWFATERWAFGIRGHDAPLYAVVRAAMDAEDGHRAALVWSGGAIPHASIALVAAHLSIEAARADRMLVSTATPLATLRSFELHLNSSAPTGKVICSDLETPRTLWEASPLEPYSGASDNERPTGPEGPSFRTSVLEALGAASNT